MHGHAPQKSGQSSLTASSGSCSNSIASNVCGMGEKGSCGPGGESVCGSTSSTGAIGSIGEGRGADSGSSNFNSGAASYTGSGACSDQVDGDGCLRSPLPATSPVTVVISTLAPVNSGTARGHLPAVSSQLVARNRQVIFSHEFFFLNLYFSVANLNALAVGPIFNLFVSVGRDIPSWSKITIPCISQQVANCTCITDWRFALTCSTHWSL